jgi:hypothetical protein
VSDFVSPTNINLSLEQVKESDNEDDDDDNAKESFETQINKVLSNLKKNNFYFLKELFSIKNQKENNNVVHVHSNKDLIKSSKIESHLRTVTKGENNSNQFAFDCNIRPDLVNK